MPYVNALASKGWQAAMSADLGLAQGLNTHNGHVISEPVGRAHGLDVVTLATVLGE